VPSKTLSDDIQAEIVGAAYKKSFEAILKPQIRFESKAQDDEKAQHTIAYVRILKRLGTRLSGLRWDFKMASEQYFQLESRPLPQQVL